MMAIIANYSMVPNFWAIVTLAAIIVVGFSFKGAFWSEDGSGVLVGFW
jgi:hypothetical protein